ncbi:LysM peptidoglycan-binding domain-containing protein [Bacillus horti]|uniref:LysM repeat protein n=1 Tax=Caldalkalibacillus horti TaxID=77523 RepID=A0ABT9W4J4_9BACI|nr:LysM peptidoglycan-binding domain-containing protein [Bacillus horti]MDQ0168174.1 LysM repeat protein [Bacillus horti]
MSKRDEQLTSPVYSEDELLEQIRALPPRSVTHKKRQEMREAARKRAKKDQLEETQDFEDDGLKDPTSEFEEEELEENEEEERRPRGKRAFLWIQVFLFTFLALILSFLLVWYWQERQNQATEPHQDPFDRLLEQGALNPGGTGVGADDDDSNESNQPEANDGSVDFGEGSEIEDNSSPEGDSVDASEEETPDQETDESRDEDEEEDSPTDRKILATHTIQPGEGLYRISINYYGQNYADELAKFNGISDPGNIQSGTTILIPEMP